MAVAADYLQDLSETLLSYRKKDVFCDVTIVASGGAHLSAHSLVLATVSNKLRAAFERTYQGGPIRRPNWGYRLTIDDCPVDCVEAVLQFVYTGSIRLDASVNKLSSELNTMSKMSTTLVMSQLSENFSPVDTAGVGNPGDELINQIGFPDALGILNAGQKLGLDPTKLASCLHALLKVGTLNIRDGTPYQLFDEDIVLDIVDKDPDAVDALNLVETIRVTSYMSESVDHAVPLPSADHCYTAATVSSKSTICQNHTNAADKKDVNCNNVKEKVHDRKSNILKTNGKHLHDLLNFEAGTNMLGDIIGIDSIDGKFEPKSFPFTNFVSKLTDTPSNVDINFPAAKRIIGEQTVVKPVGFDANLSNLTFAIIKPKEMVSTNRKLLSKLLSSGEDSFDTSLPDHEKKLLPMSVHMQPLAIQTDKPSRLVNEVNCPILYSLVPNFVKVPVSSVEMKDSFMNDNLTTDDCCRDKSGPNNGNNKDNPDSIGNVSNTIKLTASLEYCANDSSYKEKDNTVGRQKTSKDRQSKGGEHGCESFQTRTECSEHERKHTDDKPYQCDVCGRSFARHYTAIEHKRLHSGERPYQCDRCGKRFTTAGDLTKHRRSQHAAVKPHVCSICGKEMNTGREVADHRRLHEGGNRCPVCNKTFTRLHNMKEHIRGTHEGYRPYSCPYCDKHFVYSGSLRFHKKQHWIAGANGSSPKGALTAVPSQKQTELQTRSPATEPLCSCRYCGQSFDRKIDLIVHERTSHAILPGQTKNIFVGDVDLPNLDNTFSVQSQNMVDSLPQQRDDSSSLNVFAVSSCEAGALGFSSSAIIEFVQSDVGVAIGDSLTNSHNECLQQQQMRLEVGSIEDQDFADLGLSAVINFTTGEG